MLFADGAGALVFLGLWVFCVIDVITTDESRCRNLPKLVWLLIVLLLPDVGSIVWLVAGHPWQSSPARRGAYERRADSFPEYDRPGRFAATDPEADEAFLAQVRARAEAQRREYERRRKAELDAEHRRLHEPD